MQCKMFEYLAGLLLFSASLDLAKSTSSLSCPGFTRTIEEYDGLRLNVLVLVPLPDEDYDPALDQGYSIIPAVELAAEQINRRTDILPGFNLIPNMKDSGCDKPPKTAIETVSLFRELLVSGNGPLAVIGPACSEDSIFVASAFNDGFDDVRLPVFYSGTTPYLSENAAAFPDIYGMISSADILTDTLMRIAEEENWNWKNIAVLYDQTRQHFTQTYTAFVNQFNDSQEIGYTRQIADSQIPLREIIERNIRIVIVLSDKRPARQLACLAGQSTFNFVFPIYQFIFIERSLEDFLSDENAEPSFIEFSVGKRYYCDKETVMRGLNGSILLNQALDSVDPDVVTASNYTAGQIKEQYKERLFNCARGNTSLPESIYAYAYYDAMWAFAYSLHSAITPIHLFSFNKLHDAIQNISFQGVSSWIDFKDRYHVSNDVIISQVTESTLTTRGLLNRVNDNVTYNSETFISDKFKTEYSVLHPSLVALGLLLILVLFIMTLIIQVLMIVYRNTPSVKASSSRLNHFIYLGCWLLTVSIAANTFQQTVPATNGDVLCNLDVMSSNLACTLIFGTILAKSWRTYRIFNHVFKSRSNFSLHDVTLSICIIIFSLIQVILFIPMLVLSPFKAATSFTYDSSKWPPIKRLQSMCAIKSIGYLLLPIMFLLCIMIATVTIATLNRKIRRRNFRRTKHVIILVYTLTIMWAIGAPLLVLFYYLQLSLDLIYMFHTLLLTITVLLCQVLLLIPFLIPVAKGQKVSRLKTDNSSLMYSRRQSTQVSILSDRRLSFLKFAFRRSSMDPQPTTEHRSSIRIHAQRRSSLPPNPIKQQIHVPLLNNSVSTMRSFETILSCSSTDSQLSLHSPLIVSQVSTVTESNKTFTTLQSISESIDQ